MLGCHRVWVCSWHYNKDHTHLLSRRYGGQKSKPSLMDLNSNGVSMWRNSSVSPVTPKTKPETSDWSAVNGFFHKLFKSWILRVWEFNLCHSYGAGTPPLDSFPHLFDLDPERSETIKLETSMEEGLQQFSCSQMQQR